MKVTKKILSKYCGKYDLPAFGIAIYKNNILTPYIYVKQTNSLFKETSCGSGSIAVSLCTGLQKIRQPTGEYICVKIRKSNITISAHVKKIKNYAILPEGNTMSETPQLLKGFRDFLPEEKRVRDAVMNTIKRTFELYGFEPLETPTLEYASLLLGKYGDEADKLVYTFIDNGERRVGLRYDQTVPTARVLTQYRDKLPTNFRRYQMQNVFRADKPQKGRYREFTQCDIDIFGSSSPIADAEIVACSYDAFQAIGFSTAVIKINDRQVLMSALQPYATQTVSVMSIIQSIDKLDKMTPNDVTQELVQKGLSLTQAKQALDAITQAKPNASLETVMRLAQNLGVPPTSLVFSPSLARGLDYYTGTIYEIIIPEFPIGSFGGGGRYDNLIGQLGGLQTPAVGIAFGFDRIIEAVKELKLVEVKQSVAQVLVTVFDESLVDASAEIATQLRKAGIKTELYPTADKLGKQLKYANKQSISYVVVIGPEEVTNKTVQLKNMKTEEQKEVALSELVKYVT